jgi:hypothetical protein
VDKDTIKVTEDPLKPEKAVTVARADVAKMDPIDVSPMPTDLLNVLNKNEILDLLAFILSDKHPARTAAAVHAHAH